MDRSKCHRLHDRVALPVSIEQAFAFFCDAGNLERITPPELNFRILTPLPIDIRQGTLIDYRLRLFGIGFDWRTEITRWEPPHCFVDKQRHGPYRLWEHTHRFYLADGQTWMEDEVRYQLPLAPLGELAYPVVRGQLRRIFNYRKNTIRSIFNVR